jgi:hypothetical protein
VRAYLGPWLVLFGALLAPLPVYASLWPFWLAGHFVWTALAALGVGAQLLRRAPAKARRWGFSHLVGSALHLLAWEQLASEQLGTWSWMPLLAWAWLPWALSAVGPGLPAPRPTPTRRAAPARAVLGTRAGREGLG